jgi:hypothetical protein
LNGVGRRIIISVSKIKKINETKKNRKEKGKRDLLISNPHSKEDGVSLENL